MDSVVLPIADSALSDTWLPLAVLAFVFGGVLWWWHAAIAQARTRHLERTEMARALGWDYAVTADGFAVLGRTLTCDWTFSVAMSPQRAHFELGAPSDVHTMLKVRLCEVLAPDGCRPWPGENMRVIERFVIESGSAEDARRFADPQLEQLLLQWYDAQAPALLPVDALQILVSPHGVRIESTRAARDWAETLTLINLGLGFARRAGLA